MEVVLIQDIPIDKITRVISLAAATAFLLGAIVGMLSLRVGRLSRLLVFFTLALLYFLLEILAALRHNTR
jgi:hypothetical protein